jgi:hypothetical protein
MGEEDACHGFHRALSSIGAIHLCRLGPCSAPRALRRTTAWVLVERTIDLVCENPEHRDMPPGAGGQGGPEEDAKREAEAALAILRHLAAAEDTDTMVGVTEEVAGGEKGG